jgi:hypothetical protein
MKVFIANVLGAICWTVALSQAALSSSVYQRVVENGKIQILVQACPYDQGNSVQCWNGRYSDSTRFRLQDAPPFTVTAAREAIYYIKANYADTYQLQFYYGSASETPIEVTVNSEIMPAKLEKTGGFGFGNQQNSQSIAVKLIRGLNVIRLQTMSFPAILSMTFTSMSAPPKVHDAYEISFPSLKLISADTEVATGITFATIGPPFGPRNAVVLKPTSDRVTRSRAVCTFEAKEDGDYWMIIEYTSAQERGISIEVNGDSQFPVSLIAGPASERDLTPETLIAGGITGGWDFKNLQMDRPRRVHLTKGTNSIEISRDGPIPFIGLIRFVKDGEP